MNDHMRRYLDEDWDEDLESSAPKQQNQKPVTKKDPIAFDRQQRQKEWGRAIAKANRAKNKHNRQSGK